MRQQEGIRLTATQAIGLLAVVIGVPLAVLIVRDVGAQVGLRFVIYLALACVLWVALLVALRRRIGPEPNRWATVLTLSRLVTGCALAAFVLAGARDRLQPAVIVLWALVVLTATVSDWLDGPLGRREGPTRFASSVEAASAAAEVEAASAASAAACRAEAVPRGAGDDAAFE